MDKHQKPNLFFLRYEEIGPERGEVTPRTPTRAHSAVQAESEKGSVPTPGVQSS